MKQTRLLTLSLLGLGAVGCADPDPSLDLGSTLMLPSVSLDDQALLVDMNADLAYLIGVDGDAANVRRFPLPFAPVYAERRASANEALVLSVGQPGTSENEQEPAALSIVTSDGEVTEHALGNNPFDRLIQSPQGDFAFLMRVDSGDRLIRNINELVFVDLEAAPGREALTFETLDERPLGASFSQGFEIAEDDELRLAVVRTINGLVLFDLEHLDRRPTVVGLGREDGRTVYPEQIVFDDAEPRMYVRARGADDVFSLRLSPRDADAKRNRFSVSVDIVAAGRGPSDLHFFRDGDGPALLVVAPQSTQAVLVNVATAKAEPVLLPFPATGAHLFSVDSGRAEPTHALLYQLNGKQLAVMDLRAGSAENGGRLEILRSLERPLESLTVLDDGRLAAITRGRGFAIVDPARSSVFPYATSQALGEGYLDREAERVWLAPEGQRRVAFVDLDGGATDEFLLDESVVGVVPVFPANRLVVLHRSAVGLLTIVDTERPSRPTSTTFSGFLLGGLFE